MISDCIYIDTRPGQVSLFSPPAPLDDYSAWLKNQYENSLGTAAGFSWGVAQKINAMRSKSKNKNFEIEVLAHGPYAGIAAKVIGELSHGVVNVEVLS